VTGGARWQGWRWLVAAALVAVGAALAWKAFPVDEWIAGALHRIETLGAWAPLVWFVAFAVLGTLSFPTTPLYLASGILFGFWTGCAVGLVGGYAAALASFLIARHLARTSWEERLRELPRFQSLVAALEQEGFKVVVLARISPFIPASVKNYGFGLTDISFARFALATAIGQVPFATTYVYLGWVGGTAVLLGEEELSSTEIALFVAGCVASVALHAFVSWLAQRALGGPGPGQAARTGWLS
jgi:uncharacterized membrane protein YdjX (TVP38/TMEM64 family)